MVIQFDLGREGAHGEGSVISDVKLPPWANSPHEFVRINREVGVNLNLSVQHNDSILTLYVQHNDSILTLYVQHNEPILFFVTYTHLGS